MMCRPLHERLRTARERRGLSLIDIAKHWGVREQNLLLIEHDAFESLPTGLYGRTAVRSYAAAVGVPPDEALAEVLDRLRTPEDPMEGIARVRGLTCVTRRPGATSRVWMSAASITAWRQFAAAAVDGALLVGIDLLLLALTARVARVPVTDVLRLGTPSMIVLCAVIAALYFVLLGGIGRATIGARLLQAPVGAGMLDGVDIRAVLQRGVQSALADGSNLLRWATFVTSSNGR
jgi:transcriptional regulator with XRE-family HTH domain